MARSTPQQQDWPHHTDLDLMRHRHDALAPPLGQTHTLAPPPYAVARCTHAIPVMRLAGEDGWVGAWTRRTREEAGGDSH
jgi:hypothetical protein